MKPPFQDLEKIYKKKMKKNKKPNQTLSSLCIKKFVGDVDLVAERSVLLCGPLGLVYMHSPSTGLLQVPHHTLSLSPFPSGH